MTGEVTLHGEVLPIGGVKEKCIGALRSDIKQIILPEGNRGDAEDLPEDLKVIQFHFVTRMEEVLHLALEKDVDHEFLEAQQKPIFEAKL